MHHIPLDRPRPDDGHFDHHIIKTFRLHPRQRGHLGAALDLKDPDRVGFLHDFESRGVVLRNVGKIDRASAFTADLKGVLHHRHHPESEKVDFHDAEIFAVILVPLRDDASGHRCVLQRHERAQFILTNDHPARMLAEMPRQPVNRSIERDECHHARMRFGQTGLLDL